MFEYINNGFLVLGGLVIFLLILAMLLGLGQARRKGEKFTALPVLVVMFMIVVGMIIHDAYESQQRALGSLKFFKENRVIECSTLSTSYLVSKEKGWDRYKDGFTKNDIVLNIRSCRVGE